MNLGVLARTPSVCGYEDCSSKSRGLKEVTLVRKGAYFRPSDGKWIARFKCKECQRSFSQARFSPCFRQNKRKLNAVIRKLYVSGVSLRRMALILNVSRTTVTRKFMFLASEARKEQEILLQQTFKQVKLKRIFFDEMESAEKSKCLPVSIPIIIDPETRKILGFRVCAMPAKGKLAEISRKKYGHRKDEREKAARSLFKQMIPYLCEDVTVVTDMNPRYPGWIKKQFPKARHTTHPGRRGRVTGQGELKVGGFDPLFEFNHNAAMLRANVNRLFRKTWCLSKLKARLADHIAIYCVWHNTVLTSD